MYSLIRIISLDRTWNNLEYRVIVRKIWVRILEGVNDTSSCKLRKILEVNEHFFSFARLMSPIWPSVCFGSHGRSLIWINLCWSCWENILRWNQVYHGWVGDVGLWAWVVHVGLIRPNPWDLSLQEKKRSEPINISFGWLVDFPFKLYEEKNIKSKLKFRAYEQRVCTMDSRTRF